MPSKEDLNSINAKPATLVGTDSPVFLHLIDELKMGGAQTHLNTILREWLRTPEHRHLVVTLFNDGVIGDAIRSQGVEVVCLGLSGLVSKHHYWKAQNEIYKVIRMNNPSIVEAHLTYSRLLGLFAAWRAGVKKRFGFEQGDIFFKSWKWRIANFIGQFFAQKIIVCSHALGEWVERTHGVFKSKLAVVYNCVDPKAFKTSASPQINRAQWGIPENAFVFCAVGTLGSGVNKRMDVCIEGLATLADPDTYLMICGDGPLRKDLEALAAKLNVADRVKFLGLRKDVPDIMSISNSFVHAAPFEPFGIVCIEAMLMRLPVIIPDAGGIREIVQNGETGLKYPALDAGQLANQMRLLRSNPNLGDKMAANAHAMVLKTMTVENHVQTLRRLYGVT